MKSTRRCLVVLAAWWLAAGLAGAAEPAGPLYRDAAQPIEKRVDDLLGRMTLEEKVGQMNMPCVYESGLGRSIAEKAEAVQRFAAGTWRKDFGPGGGFFTLSNTILHEGPRQQAEVLNRLQRIALDETRLGIPLRGFAKVALAPGETKTCSFKLAPDDLALYDADLRRVVEPGRFRVMVGSSSEDIRLTGEFGVK